ncbi:MAG: hypothetical protein M1826_006345 [Phylliscum demangeonii]|nr:MAG: hypothetical protein M1826_006345 [Phylliscum demangeonii]
MAAAPFWCGPSWALPHPEPVPGARGPSVQWSCGDIEIAVPDLDRPNLPFPVRLALMTDAIMMECIYDYVNVKASGFTQARRAWAMPLLNCACYHRRILDRSWFQGLDNPPHTLIFRRSFTRARHGLGQSGREGKGREPPARRLTGAKRTWPAVAAVAAVAAAAAAAAAAHRFPAYSAHLLQKDGALLKKEVTVPAY